MDAQNSLVGAWTACVLLSLRGGAGVIQDLVVALGGSDHEVPTLVLVFEPLFLAGGIAFGLAGWPTRRAGHRLRRNPLRQQRDSNSATSGVTGRVGYDDVRRRMPLNGVICRHFSPRC
jgi:hypothetical protein